MFAFVYGFNYLVSTKPVVEQTRLEEKVWSVDVSPVSIKGAQPEFVAYSTVKSMRQVNLQLPLTGVVNFISPNFKEGAILEADRFNKLKISKDLSSNKVIGLIEIKDYLNKKISLNDLKEKISIKTRQYAKRQSTWSRGQMSEWQKIKYSDFKTFIKKFAKYA